ncbi:hypothetical protein FQA39_LY19430 [Lamprigera yunnana]|nr:hypothetical protein FQA39_LY19430 [Lamprigera yunnana]
MVPKQTAYTQGTHRDQMEGTPDVSPGRGSSDSGSKPGETNQESESGYVLDILMHQEYLQSESWGEIGKARDWSMSNPHGTL